MNQYNRMKNYQDLSELKIRPPYIPPGMTSLKCCLTIKEIGKMLEDKREVLFVCNQVNDLKTYDKVLENKEKGITLHDIVWHDDIKIRLLEYTHSPYGYSIECQDRETKEWDPEGLGNVIGCSIISALLKERTDLLKQNNAILKQNRSLQKAHKIFEDDYFKNLEPDEIARLAKSAINISADNTALYSAIFEISKKLPKRGTTYEELARSIQQIKDICKKHNPLEAIK